MFISKMVVGNYPDLFRFTFTRPQDVRDDEANKIVDKITNMEVTETIILGHDGALVKRALQLQSCVPS